MIANNFQVPFQQFQSSKSLVSSINTVACKLNQKAEKLVLYDTMARQSGYACSHVILCHLVFEKHCIDQKMATESVSYVPYELKNSRGENDSCNVIAHTLQT